MTAERRIINEYSDDWRTVRGYLRQELDALAREYDDHRTTPEEYILIREKRQALLALLELPEKLNNGTITIDSSYLEP